MPDKINIDIDALLNEVKIVRGSMVVATRSINGLFADGDTGYYELNAMVEHLDRVMHDATGYLSRIIKDLRSGGAQDYDPNDNWMDAE